MALRQRLTQAIKKVKPDKVVLRKKGSLRRMGASQTSKFRKSATGGKKGSRARAAGIQRLAQAITGVGGQRAGAGRPRGTYKYGMPIHEYKKLQSRRKALLGEFRRQQAGQLSKRGYTSEQVEELRQEKTIREQMPTQLKTVNPADEDLAFRKHLAKNTVSPTTQAILNKLRHTQLKAERDDVEQQRRIKEKKMVESAGSLLATPYIFNKHQLDTTGVDSQDNILMAPNTFKEIPGSPNLLKQTKLNVLQTTESGNTLRF